MPRKYPPHFLENGHIYITFLLKRNINCQALYDTVVLFSYAHYFGTTNGFKKHHGKTTTLLFSVKVLYRPTKNHLITTL